MMTMALGGHVSEELVFGEMTTGAHDDIGKVTQIARNMVTQWGMSAAMGPRTFGKRQSMVFLGRNISEERDYSEKTAEEIDTEVKRLIAEAHERCKQILRDKREVLDRLAAHLIEVETIEGEDLIAILDPTGEYRTSRVDDVTPTGPSATTARKSKEDQDKKPNQGKPGLVWGS
jgi:cell division protease FtsH